MIIVLGKEIHFPWETLNDHGQTKLSDQLENAVHMVGRQKPIHYELLKPKETINSDMYCLKLDLQDEILK